MENKKRVLKREFEDAKFDDIHQEETRPKKAKFDTDKNGRLNKLADLPLNLVCQWDSCDFTSNSWEKFNEHLMVRHALDGRHCRWEECGFEAASEQLLVQHLSYHGYISKLAAIGENLVEKNGLTACRKARVSSIPRSYVRYECCWKDCFTIHWTNIYEFLTHLAEHAGSCLKDSGHNKFQCRWKECQTMYPSRVKLAEHMRTHSGEKLLACPTCFAGFANTTKFSDHRTRQRDKNSKDVHRCPQCPKGFQNKRLLSDHFRTHTISKRSRYDQRSSLDVFLKSTQGDRTNTIISPKDSGGTLSLGCPENEAKVSDTDSKLEGDVVRKETDNSRPIQKYDSDILNDVSYAVLHTAIMGAYSYKRQNYKLY